MSFDEFSSPPASSRLIVSMMTRTTGMPVALASVSAWTIIASALVLELRRSSSPDMMPIGKSSSPWCLRNAAKRRVTTVARSAATYRTAPWFTGRPNQGFPAATCPARSFIKTDFPLPGAPYHPENSPAPKTLRTSQSLRWDSEISL